MIESRLIRVQLVAGLFLVALSNSAGAQKVVEVPCCQITAIDTNHGVVSAKTTGATATFSFKFDSGPIPSFLHVGEKIWSHGGKVSISGPPQYCCTIIPSIPVPRGNIGITTHVNSRASYSSDSAARVRECNQVAQTSFPQGGHTCVPKGAMVSSGKSPDGSDATYSWTCNCS